MTYHLIVIEGKLISHKRIRQVMGMARYDFKTKFHKNPQLATTYGQKGPIAQYVRRIDAQIAVRFCAICLIYIMAIALGDILIVSILIEVCVVYSPSLHCVCHNFAILLRCNVGILA